MTLLPESEAELSEIVRDAHADGRSLSISGGNTRGVGLSGETALSLSNLSGVTLYEPASLTLVAKSGTPVSEIEALLDTENQMLAFEPADPRIMTGATGAPTIGGIAATNASGPRRMRMGAARDYLLGMRFVDGRGTTLKNGGRVMKNVTGLDLVKLLSGSYGTLGVISEVSLKVLPKTEASATLVWQGLPPQDTLEVFTTALKSPFEVTGAAHSPENGEQTLIRLEGFAESVAYRVERLSALMPRLPDHVETGAAANAALWAGIRDITPLAGQSGNLWRTSIKTTDMTRLTGLTQYQHLIDWGGGLVWTLTPNGTDLRAALPDLQGHITLMRGTGFARFHPEPAPVKALTQGLRAQFDPKGILNPGLMD